jgi:transcriptional regulator with XRE-family HTH domain
LALGDYLRELRHDRNLSIREAAKRIGVSFSRLEELESGRSRTTGKPTLPSTDMLIKIARFYEQPLPLLLEMASLAEVSPDERQEAETVQLLRGMTPKARNLVLSIMRVIDAQDRPESIK